MVEWTKKQQEAIYTDGCDILVAAAAGSGKTAVLVERIIQKVIQKENPVDIDSLLVVTFTNAAAQEMRNRVGIALEKAIAEAPSSGHLKKQLSLLQRASISTLHAFCMEIVKQYAYLLDIDPAFRIANDMEGDLLKQEVLDELFEDWYGKDGDAMQSFFAVVDRFSDDRSDVDVEELILKLYTFAMQNPYPEQWLDDMANVYAIGEQWDEKNSGWLSILKKAVKNQLMAVKSEISKAKDIILEADGPYHYADAVDADAALVEEAFQHLDSWNDLQSSIQAISFQKLSGKRVECNEEKKEHVKSLRNGYKKRLTDMAEKWFSRDLEHHVQDMREMFPIMEQLVVLVKEFKERFALEKKEKAIVDFSDLEHFTLTLLLDEASDGNPRPSHVAEQLKDTFSEILIDEYQDTNLVQETILSLVSDQVGTGNRFMVGDVKQSIYRFRHAEPSLFIDKYKRFSTGESTGHRIDLASNFRSRQNILSGANYIFRQIFDETLGEITYDHDSELLYGNKSYDSLSFAKPEQELIIIDRETPEETEQEPGDESYQDLEKAQLEARAYAAKIKEWIHPETGNPLQIVDKGTNKQRDAQYRDIVILQRSMTWAPTIADELKKQGIPIYAELSTGYFEAIEVKIMLSLLKVIDNPQQDIPLASVLRSPIVGLDEEALAQIRLKDRHNNYYAALMKYTRETDNATAKKTQRFLDQLKTFRLASRQGALSELIWDIYRMTGYYDFVGGMPGGRQRQANLRALYDRARTYEATSFRGLFRFLRFIERMEERGDDLGAARALSEQEDVVRMMTIHKSKGLEFPIVILGGMDKQFNLQDLRQRYLLHKDYGFASKFVDPVKRITYPTLFYHALQYQKLEEQLSEEMRVLYVALTRAKEKMIMVANVASYDKKIAKWNRVSDHDEWVLPAYERMEAKSYLDWIGPALIRHERNEMLRLDTMDLSVPEEIRLDPSDWDVSIVHGSEYANLSEKVTQEDTVLKETIDNWEPLTLERPVLQKQVDDTLNFRYPFLDAAYKRAKQSVTEIKRMREEKDAYSADDLIRQPHVSIMKRPKFMQKEEYRMSPAEVGTVVHTVMQHIPFTKPMNTDEIAAFIDSLVFKEILTDRESEVVDKEMIQAFLSSDMAAFMRESSIIYREVPFSLTLSAKDVYPSWKNEVDESVLIQGVIDCVIPGKNGWIILDYKTDAIKEELSDTLKKQLSECYKTQVELYRHAIETIWKKPVEEAYLYYFHKQFLLKM